MNSTFDVVNVTANSLIRILDQIKGKWRYNLGQRQERQDLKGWYSEASSFILEAVEMLAFGASEGGRRIRENATVKVPRLEYESLLSQLNSMLAGAGPGNSYASPLELPSFDNLSPPIFQSMLTGPRLSGATLIYRIIELGMSLYSHERPGNSAYSPEGYIAFKRNSDFNAFQAQVLSILPRLWAHMSSSSQRGISLDLQIIAFEARGQTVRQIKAVFRAQAESARIALNSDGPPNPPSDLGILLFQAGFGGIPSISGRQPIKHLAQFSLRKKQVYFPKYR